MFWLRNKKKKWVHTLNKSHETALGQGGLDENKEHAFYLLYISNITAALNIWVLWTKNLQ